MVVDLRLDPGVALPGIADDERAGFDVALDEVVEGLAAIAAVRAVVARLALPITQIYIEPGPFECGVIWPGLQSMPICFGVAVIPGTSMHGWVAFTGTAKAAAVSLFRAPPAGTTPSGPWQATIVAFVAPPTGWTMP